MSTQNSTNGVTTLVHLYTARMKKDGTYPVKLRVIYNREYHDYAIGTQLTIADFERATGDKPRGDAKDLQIYFSSMEARARQIIDDLPRFSFAQFKMLFLSKQRNKNCVFDRYRAFLEEMESEGRVKTAATYRHALLSLQSFHSQETLPLVNVTVEFLKSYEAWMLKPRKRANGKKSTIRANSTTTVSMYARTLRTILNKAIAEKLIPQDVYPFGKYGYQIPASQNVKKALQLEDVKKIFQYEAALESSEAFYRDLWLFSYLCNGANMKDIARMTYASIDGDRVIFVRAKTQNTSRKKLKPIVAHLMPEAKAIVEHWGTKPRNQDNYVFPILAEGISPLKEVELVHQMTKQVNKYIGRIAKAVGIEHHVTTYTARHSFATVLKRSNAPISYISEALGHKDLRTTENYLDSFNDDARELYATKLTAF